MVEHWFLDISWQWGLDKKKAWTRKVVQYMAKYAQECLSTKSERGNSRCKLATSSFWTMPGACLQHYSHKLVLVDEDLSNPTCLLCVPEPCGSQHCPLISSRVGMRSKLWQETAWASIWKKSTPCNTFLCLMASQGYKSLDTFCIIFFHGSRFTTILSSWHVQALPKKISTGHLLQHYGPCC